MSTEALQAEWLKPLDEVMSVLKVGSTWDSVKLSDCLKLLFREILLPTYSRVGEGIDRFLDHFKNQLWPSFDQINLSKRGLAHLFEQLVLMHSYTHTRFEMQHLTFVNVDSTLANQDDPENAEGQNEQNLKKVLPPLFRLEHVLRECSDVAKIRESCSKPADFSMALTYARLACF